jgi:hypothetical protein
VLIRQVFYHLSHISSPCVFLYCFRADLWGKTFYIDYICKVWILQCSTRIVLCLKAFPHF